MYLAGEKRVARLYLVFAILAPIVIPWIDMVRRAFMTMSDTKAKASTFGAAFKYLCDKKLDFASIMKGVYPGMGFFFWVILAASVVFILLAITGFITNSMETKRLAAKEA